MNDTTPAPPGPARDKKTVVDRLTGTTARVSALLVGVAAVLAQIPLVTNAAKSAYCSVFACDTPTQKPPSTLTPAPIVPPGDGITIQRIGPRPGTLLRTGQSSDIELDLTYVLSSADQAFLTVYLEELEGTAGGCYGQDHHTNGGADLRAVRGEHFASVKIHWPGTLASGFLTVGANFWKDVDGHVGNIIKALGLFPEVCYPFGP
jgi:hypothetical protein